MRGRDDGDSGVRVSCSFAIIEVAAATNSSRPRGPRPKGQSERERERGRERENGREHARYKFSSLPAQERRNQSVAAVERLSGRWKMEWQRQRSREEEAQ